MVDQIETKKICKNEIQIIVRTQTQFFQISQSKIILLSCWLQHIAHWMNVLTLVVQIVTVPCIDNYR